MCEEGGPNVSPSNISRGWSAIAGAPVSSATAWTRIASCLGPSSPCLGRAAPFKTYISSKEMKVRTRVGWGRGGPWLGLSMSLCAKHKQSSRLAEVTCSLRHQSCDLLAFACDLTPAEGKGRQPGNTRRSCGQDYPTGDLLGSVRDPGMNKVGIL